MTFTLRRRCHYRHQSCARFSGMLALMCHFKCKNLVGELLPASPATPSAAAAECLRTGFVGGEKKERVCLSSTVIRWRLEG